MDLIQIIVLACVQGLTEFLPISSSAHLILVPHLFGWPDQGLAFDVAVHMGTLAAVLSVFRSELATMTSAWLDSIRGRGTSADGRLAWAVLLGTVPVGLAGLFGGDFVESELRSPRVIAAATAGFGLLLWAADALGTRRRDEHSLGWPGVMLIGVAQALALIPGTSRSGVTITAGLALGLDRRAAARFSFLLAIPVIALAGARETLTLVRTPIEHDWGALLIGAFVSGVSAWLCIRWFLRFLERAGMLPFVLYRLVLAALILALAV